MANTSILNAFERMWQHIVVKLGEKANTSDIADLQEQLEERSQVQIITWGADD